MNRVLIGSLAAFLAAAACATPETERLQEEPAPGASSPHPDEGEIVRAIVVTGHDAPEAFVGYLKHTRVGDPLSSAALADDLKLLWAEHRLIVTQVHTEDALGGGVHVCFDVQRGTTAESGDSRDGQSLREVQMPEGWEYGDPVLVEASEDRVVYCFSLSSPR